jgi:hypothetical protein
VVTGTDNGVLLCYEAEQLSLRRVAAAVLDQRFQNVEVADRLHTRIDVSWTPLWWGLGRPANRRFLPLADITPARKKRTPYWVLATTRPSCRFACVRARTLRFFA